MALDAAPLINPFPHIDFAAGERISPADLDDYRSQFAKQGYFESGVLGVREVEDYVALSESAPDHEKIDAVTIAARVNRLARLTDDDRHRFWQNMKIAHTAMKQVCEGLFTHTNHQSIFSEMNTFFLEPEFHIDSDKQIFLDPRENIVGPDSAVIHRGVSGFIAIGAGTLFLAGRVDRPDIGYHVSPKFRGAFDAEQTWQASDAELVFGIDVTTMHSGPPKTPGRFFTRVSRIVVDEADYNPDLDVEFEQAIQARLTT